MENDQDKVYFNPDIDPEDPQMSVNHYKLSKHAYAWKNGRWDYGSGYYALMSDVPKGIEYAEKGKFNIMKLEM